MRKKIDNRIRVLIENGVIQRHRSLFVVVGEKARDQVVILHHMLSKAVVRARPSVLWCYKKELGFSSHRRKRMKKLQKTIKSGKLDVKEDDPFGLFIASTSIRYCYYNETHKILGNTYGMCVLQDFEALTPNLLARTVETVEGGGLVVLLLHQVESLRQLFTLAMDVHSRYRTESHQDVVARFNERFILSLASCASCVVLDDQLNILPLSSHILNLEPVPPKPIDGPLAPNDEELRLLKVSLKETQPVGSLINCCKTLDQGTAVLKFIEAISEKSLRSTVVLTAARGRGKSAAIGLAIASAVAFGYANVFVTAPSPENLKTLFEFIFKGFDALSYEEHTDYELVQSTDPEFNKAIVRVNIYREHRQTIQYIDPKEAHKLGQAELLCIDEAAAIPLPLVKAMLGPYLVFMSSTINGYEGTGRSLSLKLISQLRQQGGSTVGTLHELKLTESIRYADGDPVERWLYDLLCLDATLMTLPSATGCPIPANCDLYYVNRDTLFSYHPLAENFLQKLMALYVAAHYKNSPNDLQMLSDAPAHHIFCLLAPRKPKSNNLPEILCVLQVCLEGDISKQSIMNSIKRGKRSSGDLIPWVITEQFVEPEFGSLSGARIVRIATHPDYQSMGYGKRALDLLELYYSGKVPFLSEDGAGVSNITTVDSAEAVGLLKEKVEPRKSLPPLLCKLTERPAEQLDYLGVSYGMTSPLLKFWKRSGFVPVYLSQKANDLTGEFSCIMLKQLVAVSDEEEGEAMETGTKWLPAFWADFRERLVELLADGGFCNFPASLALSLLQQKQFKVSSRPLTGEELNLYFKPRQLKRLEMYAQNLADYHLIKDLLPRIAKLFILGQVDVTFSAAQAAILVALGLQHKTVDQCAKDLEVPPQQVLGLFNRSLRKVSQTLHRILELKIEESLGDLSGKVMRPLQQSLDDDLEESAIHL